MAEETAGKMTKCAPSQTKTKIIQIMNITLVLETESIEKHSTPCSTRVIMYTFMKPR